MLLCHCWGKRERERKGKGKHTSKQNSDTFYVQMGISRVHDHLHSSRTGTRSSITDLNSIRFAGMFQKLQQLLRICLVSSDSSPNVDEIFNVLLSRRMSKMLILCCCAMVRQSLVSEWWFVEDCSIFSSTVWVEGWFMSRVSNLSLLFVMMLEMFGIVKSVFRWFLLYLDRLKRNFRPFLPSLSRRSNWLSVRCGSSRPYTSVGMASVL